MKRVFILAILVVCLFGISAPVCADTTYTVDDAGFSVTLPDSYETTTRAIDEESPLLEYFYSDVDELLEIMEEDFLLAVDMDREIVIGFSCYENEGDESISSLAGASDDEVFDYFYYNFEENAQPHVIDHKQTRFLSWSIEEDDEGGAVIYYNTVCYGHEYLIWAAAFFDDIELASLRAEMDSIVATIEFNHKANLGALLNTDNAENNGNGDSEPAEEREREKPASTTWNIVYILLIVLAVIVVLFVLIIVVVSLRSRRQTQLDDDTSKPAPLPGSGPTSAEQQEPPVQNRNDGEQPGDTAEGEPEISPAINVEEDAPLQDFDNDVEAESEPEIAPAINAEEDAPLQNLDNDVEVESEPESSPAINTEEDAPLQDLDNDVEAESEPEISSAINAEEDAPLQDLDDDVEAESEPEIAPAINAEENAPLQDLDNDVETENEPGTSSTANVQEKFSVQDLYSEAKPEGDEEPSNENE